MYDYIFAYFSPILLTSLHLFSERNLTAKGAWKIPLLVNHHRLNGGLFIKIMVIQHIYKLWILTSAVIISLFDAMQF